MKSSVWSRQITQGGSWRTNFTSLLFPISATLIALLVGVVSGIFGTYSWAIVIGTLLMIIVISLRQDELAATLIIAIHLYVDYYLGIYLIAGIMAIAILIIFFLARSPRFPWTYPRALWLWLLLLILAIFPMFRGVSLGDGFNYYFNVLFLALIMFWLGTTIAKNATCIRRLLILLSFFVTFVALVSIYQYVTGVLVFSSSRYDRDLAISNNFELFSGDNVHRVGAYFVHPNSNGGFLSMIFCLSLGLFVDSSSIKGKVFYFIEMCILLPTLLFTYSTESWIAVSVGTVAFLLLVGHNKYRVLILSLALITTIFMNIFFPSQLALLQQHATSPSEVPLREAAWQTGIAVISAFPLTGLGLGRHVYFQRADPYRVVMQYIPLDHPHNAFLELMALGGITVGIVFILLLLFTFWLAFRNWILADIRTRPLIGSGIAAAIALTSFSISDAGWTLPPLLATSWMILGGVSSPYIRKNLSDGMKEEESS